MSDIPAAQTKRFTVSTTPEGWMAIDGPEDYMLAKGSELIEKIGAGNDAIFNMTCHLSPTVEIAVAVRLQTDYAGWKGTRDFLRAHGPGKESEHEKL